MGVETLLVVMAWKMKSLRLDMTYGAVLKIYWFVGPGDGWAVSEDRAVSPSWSITAGCCVWESALSACKLNQVIWISVSSNRWQTLLCHFLSHFAVPSVSEASLKPVAVSLGSLIFYSAHLSWKMLSNAGAMWLVKRCGCGVCASALEQQSPLQPKAET